MIIRNLLFPLPLLSSRCLEQVFEIIDQGSTQSLASWMVMLNTMNLRKAEKKILEELFASFHRRFCAEGVDPIAFLRGFYSDLIINGNTVSPTAVVAMLAHWEDTVCRTLRHALGPGNAEQGCAWIRSLILNVHALVLQMPLWPCKEEKTETEWKPPLTRLLNRVARGEAWQWAALVDRSASCRLLDAAMATPEGEWQEADMASGQAMDLEERVRTVDRHTLCRSVAPGVDLVVKTAGLPGEETGFRVNQVAQWLSLCFDLSARITGPSGEAGDLFHLYDAVLNFDEALLQSRDLEEILSSTVDQVCRIGRFRRGALFWYTPLTRTVVGAHAFNLRREDILRIREYEENLSGLQEVIRSTTPVFYENVARRLPDHYVQTFHLTSLLFCPMVFEPRRPGAVLLLDQGGTPFQPEDRTVRLVHTLLCRASKPIATHLSGSPRHTSRQTPTVLTRREHQILQLIADGLDTRDISARLHLSEYTVSEYVGTILRKLGASNRAQAVAVALRRHLIQ
ncbi:LuxR C-terminal-related transcriptional regulator [Kyrpidia sp.]|uniref:LuxR C-terminal-related transcriptional regulator n=1 Tax=Kyrpidia sp. TaxID=2073077 RepID=UPI00258F60E0|nr:LuxR C-terminal-related transcriptional regulator [Kyrpidia sp.]MCL6576694.1 LuxR C-terminal-related transcriptional regulator [Kyrpidia sp.]